MEEMIMTNDDLEYLASTSSTNLNMILANMTSLMDENNSKVEFLENQTWFQRMSMTISGQKKMTEDEIARNHDKISLYTTQAMAELLNRNLIDHKVMLSLGNRVNELYAGQIEIKQMLGAFVSKLNEKIESIDNFHMLMEEIGQHVYSRDHKMFAICSIMSQIDSRTVHDDRKMEILKRAMHEEGIITEEETPLVDFLVELLELNDSDAGVIAMMLDAANEEYVAQVCRNVMFEFYSLNDGVRKMKSKKAIATSVLERMQIDTTYAVSTAELCNTLVDVLAKNIVIQAIQEKEDSAKERYSKMSEYMDNVVKMQEFYRTAMDSWWIRVYELFGENFERYSGYIQDVVLPFLSGQSLMGKQYKEDILAIETCCQHLLDRYPEIYDANTSEISNNGSICLYYIVSSGVLIKPEEVDMQSMTFYGMPCQKEVVTFSQLIEKDFQLRIQAFQNTPNFNDTITDENTRVDKENSNYNSFAISPLELYYYDQFTEFFRSIFSAMKDKIGDSYGDYNDLFDLFDRFPCTFGFSSEPDKYAIFDRIKYFKEVLRIPYIVIEYEGKEYEDIAIFPPNLREYRFKVRAYNINDEEWAICRYIDNSVLFKPELTCPYYDEFIEEEEPDEDNIEEFFELKRSPDGARLFEFWICAQSTWYQENANFFKVIIETMNMDNNERKVMGFARN